MFKWLRKLFEKHTRREIALDQCYDALEALKPASPEYAAVVAQITKLEAEPNKAGIGKDTRATLAVYAGLVVLTLVSELFGHSITTRALTSIPFRPRL